MAIDPALIRSDAETLALLKQLFPQNASGFHRLRYRLAPAGTDTSALMDFEEQGSPTRAFTAEEETFIVQVFDRLSQQIAIAPERSDAPDHPFQLASVSSIRVDPEAGGITHSSLWWGEQLDLAASYVVIELDLDDDPNPALDAYEQGLIVHEIGHALGLDHPGGQPNDPAYNDRDTIMSYNVGGSEEATWFSDSDLLALREIWGPAGQGGSTAAEASPFRLDSLISGGWLIQGFDPDAGDVLELNASTLPVDSTRLKVVASRRGLAWAQRSGRDLVFDDRTSSLYLNANGRAAGWGADGGLLAVFEQPLWLTSSGLRLVNAAA